MKATFRIVTPAAASAAVAALLLTGCADKPVRIPGGAFVEEPYTGETETKSHTVLNNGEETVDTEIIFIDDDVPVGPVESGNQSGQQGGASGQQGGGATQLQPVDEQPVKSNVPEGSVEYKVVKGDTLWSIGMVYGVSVARLAEINGIDEKSTLRVGQVLMIPPDAGNAVAKPVQKKTDTKAANATSTKTSTTSSTTKTSTATSTKTQPATKDGETLYVVKSGDNLSMIAYRHHVKLADLIAANKVDPKAILRVGQTLVIPAPTAKAASGTSAGTKTTTTTTKTDSASAGTKPASATTTTTTKTDSITKPASTTKGGEGTGGIVEPIGGSMSSSSASSTTTKPASASNAATGSATAGLAPVSGLSDADIFAVPIDSESTLEEVAKLHDKNLEDLIRLNPEFKPGQKIPVGTAVKMPLF